MESKINRFGILDFFKAFSSDTSVNDGKVSMRDLKPSDWNVVPETVKKELLVESPKRIQKIYKSLLTKINDAVLNVKTSAGKGAKSIKSLEVEHNEIENIEEMEK